MINIRGIHDYDAKLKSVLKWMNKFENKTNLNTVFKFKDYMSANGASKARIIRYITVFLNYQNIEPGKTECDLLNIIPSACSLTNLCRGEPECKESYVCNETEIPKGNYSLELEIECIGSECNPRKFYQNITFCILNKSFQGC